MSRLNQELGLLQGIGLLSTSLLGMSGKYQQGPGRPLPGRLRVLDHLSASLRPAGNRRRFFGEP
jgi:hypothetical protein